MGHSHLSSVGLGVGSAICLVETLGVGESSQIGQSHGAQPDDPYRPFVHPQLTAPIWSMQIAEVGSKAQVSSHLYASVVGEALGVALGDWLSVGLRLGNPLG